MPQFVTVSYQNPRSYNRFSKGAGSWNLKKRPFCFQGNLIKAWALTVESTIIQGISHSS